MNKQKDKQAKKIRRQRRARAKIRGTQEKPRLNVSRSNKNIFLQIINDEKGETIASINSKSLNKKGTKTEISKEAGKVIAQLAKEKEIKKVVFDRGGRMYHGRVRAAAQGAREEGLEF